MSGALYFGCWQGVGHYFWTPGMDDGRGGPLTPWGYGVEQLTPTSTTEQGAAAVHHMDGWSALAIHDYTVDRRGNSKSVFAFQEADLTFSDLVHRAQGVFPEVINRLTKTPIFLAAGGEEKP